MIIGFMGLKGSGKDTAGAYLVKEHGFERRAFANPLKHYIASVLDIPFHKIDDFKNDGTVFVTTGYKNTPTDNTVVDEDGDTWIAGIDYPEGLVPSNMWSPIREQTLRDFIRNVGQAMKPILGEDIWANQTLPVGGFYSGRKIVITDVRFEVEHQRIKDLGGSIVRIVKTRVDPETEQDHHRSETELAELSYDYWIENNGSYEQLYTELERMLEVLT